MKTAETKKRRWSNYVVGDVVDGDCLGRDGMWHRNPNTLCHAYLVYRPVDFRLRAIKPPVNKTMSRFSNIVETPTTTESAETAKKQMTEKIIGAGLIVLSVSSVIYLIYYLKKSKIFKF